jgi:PAS domain S-box-containing protein
MKPPGPDLVRLLAAGASEMLSRHTPEGRFLWASPASRGVLGRTPARLAGNTLAQLAAAGDRPRVESAFRDAVASRHDARVTYRLRRPDRQGRERWCETTARAWPRRRGRVTEVHATTREITEFKRLERVLETIANEWRTTVDSTQDVIIMLDRRSRVVRANRATTRFLGRGFPEILGEDPRALLGLDRRRAPLFHFADLERGTRHHAAEIYLPRRRMWIFYSVDPIADAAGRATGAVLVVRDISERKRADRQLRAYLRRMRQLSSHLQAVREEERALISREIHDELGHALTGLKMEAAWIASRLPGDAAEPRERARSMASLIDSTISTIRRIATELRPGVLDDLGLLPAIEWQAGEFAQRTGIATRVEAAAAGAEGAAPALDRVALDRDRATAVFRIFQEALTNVARHARAARVTVTASGSARQLVLRIRDDGGGFDPREAAARRSLGLLGMQERAALFGGSVEVASRRGQGTTVTVRIPTR